MTETMITYYRGQRVDEMSREDLIKAVIDLGKWNQALIEGGWADRMMVANALKGLRPR